MANLDYNMHIRIPIEIYKRLKKVESLSGERPSTIVRMCLLESLMNTRTFVKDIVSKVDLERTNV